MSNPLGGLARRASFIDSVRQEGCGVCIVDAGDFIAREGRISDKNSIQLRIAAEFMLQAMDRLGYAAANVGEGDLVFGDSFLAGIAEGLDVQLVSASVFAGGARPFAPARMFTTAGITIGIAGIAWEGFTPYVAEHSDPGRPMAMAATADAMREGLEEIAGADVKVLLAHAPLSELRILLADIPGYDIAIAGHDTNMEPFAEPELAGATRLVNRGWDGTHAGRLDLTFDRTGALIAVAGSAVLLDAAWPDHPDMLTLHADYLARVAAALRDILAEYPVSPPPTGTRYAGVQSCVTCHPVQWGSWRQTTHALAWQTLVERSRDYDPECFACHTNGFQWTGGFTLYEDTPAMAAVQCESCHGAGADHCDAPLLPYSRPGEAACLRCHVPLHSPEFDYGTYLPKVAHPKAP
ncbi:MAG TPA: hypothetical protein DCM87_20445 [Planctomycetes bacterium]|nr:hypothetical protein [Planctomycetota bacterium]